MSFMDPIERSGIKKLKTANKLHNNKQTTQQQTKNEIGTRLFFSRYLFLFFTNRRFEVAKDVSVSAAVLCPTVYISDVMKKAGVCGKPIKYVTRAKVFLALGDDRRASQHRVRLRREKVRFEAKPQQNKTKIIKQLCCIL